MTKTSDLKSACIETIEQVIDQKPVAHAQHLETCATCKQMAATAQFIKNMGAPANYTEEFPGLKQRIMQKIQPVFKARYQKQTQRLFSDWWIKLAMAGAAFVLLFALFNTGVVVHNSSKPLPIKLAQSFKMTVNEGPEIELSIDSPVTIDSDQIAKITLPAGSILKVSGPARLNVLPRGFHLIEGSLIAEVTKNPNPFKATTPHGQISVLGTIFSCNSTSRRTVIKVLRGKVKVTPDSGQPAILSAGESLEMRQHDITADSETIPSIDSE